ncbi:PEP-CTERM sorting domain-containing protein [Granulicella sibirica]|uniref:Ice-binding protein C-terminal domain-containing protein n=1 Tax=Granulicella sibirica TaxID=2479048 RepID=A0A4Q0SU82_9BACT|nr:PEP-CTERM sorting domain-containing protein [Granulicella sibirica]RXH54593.1 hypothetical protein GRAN_3697 [Granulicella sibirica]
MKSLKTLPLFCVLLLPFSQVANADPIPGSLYPNVKSTSDQGSPNKLSQPFSFDNATANSTLFPLSSGTTEVNHLLAVTLETTPPVVAGSSPHPRTPPTGTTDLAAEAGFQDPAMRSGIPTQSNGGRAFQVGASPAASTGSLEPSSLILLGTGLICAAAVVLRRRRTI